MKWLALIFLATIGCSGSNNEPKVDPMVDECVSTPFVLGLGDSITFDPDGYWPAIEAEFDAKAVAFPGWTTVTFRPRGILYRSLRIPQNPPCKVTILLGTNDAQLDMRSPANYLMGLSALANQLIEDGVGEVILMTAPIELCRPRVMDLVDAYAPLVRTFCGQDGDQITCGPDLHRDLGANDFKDCVHPGPSGAAYITKKLRLFL